MERGDGKRDRRERRERRERRGEGEDVEVRGDCRLKIKTHPLNPGGISKVIEII